MKKVSIPNFFIASLVFGLLSLVSFAVTFGADEGTLDADSPLIVFAKLFPILWFPAKIFLLSFASVGEATFWAGWVLSSLMYGWLTERLMAFARAKST